MTLYRNQVTIEPANGVPADRVVNTLYHDVPSLPDALTNIHLAIINFYQAAVGIFSPLVATTGHTVTAYNMELAPPRPPVVTTPFNLTIIDPVGSSSMPAEVALVHSFKADPIAGISDAKLRGRNFLGPLGSDNLDLDTGMVSQAICDAVAGFAQDMAVALSDEFTDPGVWVVVSGVDTPSQFFTPVRSGHVNNEFDTQRSRGREESYRASWSLSV